MQVELPRAQVWCIINNGTHSPISIINRLKQPRVTLYSGSARETQTVITTTRL